MTRLGSSALAIAAVLSAAFPGCTLDQTEGSGSRSTLVASGQACSSSSECDAPLVCRAAQLADPTTCRPTGGDGAVCSVVDAKATAEQIAVIREIRQDATGVKALKELMQFLKDNNVANDTGAFITKLANPLSSAFFKTTATKVKAAFYSADAPMIKMIRLLVAPDQRAQLDAGVTSVLQLNPDDRGTIFGLIGFAQNLEPLLSDAINKYQELVKGMNNLCTSGRCECPEKNKIPFLLGGEWCAAESYCVGGSEGPEAPPVVVDPCANNKQDPGETDVDCGGQSCQKCVNGKACKLGTDCSSGHCDSATSRCADKPADPEPPAPTVSCTNSKKDGQETDVDCGGSSCDKCANGKTCSGDTDCTSGYCKSTSTWDPTIHSVVTIKVCADKPAAPEPPAEPAPADPAPADTTCPVDRWWSEGTPWNGVLHECWRCDRGKVSVYRGGQWLVWHTGPAAACDKCNGLLTNGTWKAGHQVGGPSDAYQYCAPAGGRGTASTSGAYAGIGAVPDQSEELQDVVGGCSTAPASGPAGLWQLVLTLGLLGLARKRSTGPARRGR